MNNFRILLILLVLTLITVELRAQDIFVDVPNELKGYIYTYEKNKGYIPPIEKQIYLTPEDVVQTYISTKYRSEIQKITYEETNKKILLAVLSDTEIERRKQWNPELNLAYLTRKMMLDFGGDSIALLKYRWYKDGKLKNYGNQITRLFRKKGDEWRIVMNIPPESDYFKLWFLFHYINNETWHLILKREDAFINETIFPDCAGSGGRNIEISCFYDYFYSWYQKERFLDKAIGEFMERALDKRIK